MRRALPAIESCGTAGIREQIEDAAEQLGPSDPRSSTLVAFAGVLAMLEGDVAAAGDLRRFAGASEWQSTRIMLAVARLMMGDASEVEVMVDYAEAFATEPDGSIGDRELVVFALAWAGEYSAASRLVDVLVARARADGVDGLAFALTGRAHLNYRVGHWHAARVDATEAVELRAPAHRPSALAHSLFVLARIEAGMGNTTTRDRRRPSCVRHRGTPRARSTLMAR